MNKYVYGNDEEYSLEEFEKASSAEIEALFREQDVLDKGGVVYH